MPTAAATTTAATATTQTDARPGPKAVPASRRQPHRTARMTRPPTW